MNHIGIDVSNAVFDATLRDQQAIRRRKFPCTTVGYAQAIAWMTAGGVPARVCLEATGIYHLALSLALAAAEGIEVMVLNPKGARRYREVRLIRAKTDASDADGLLHYLEHMPFRAWKPPSAEALTLQALAHRIDQLTAQTVAERSRLHAARRAGNHTLAVQADLRAHLDELARRKRRLQQQALELVAQQPALAEDLRLIDTVPGFGPLSATLLLAELLPLDPDLVASQWVAQAGLDPRPLESGSSQNPPRRLSKQGNPRLRATLFMPALAAIRKDPNVRAFYQALLDRGKAKMQAIAAVMRKLLRAIWGILKHQLPWDGDRFYVIPGHA